jgi:hypothetical protein
MGGFWGKTRGETCLPEPKRPTGTATMGATAAAAN